MTRLRSVLLLAGLLAFAAYANPPTGGFWENDSSSTAYPPLTATQISAFMPTTRTKFTFPSPYGTTGVRVTLPSDCPNSSNCINYIGYNYWARMNNSAGSPFMYIMVGVGKASAGGSGPTIYKFDKDKDIMTKVGPIFSPGNSEANDSGEQMYFSYGHPDALYFNTGDTTLKRINVLTKVVTTIFNVSSYASGDHIFECSSSDDDNTHACILEDSSYNALGCLVYHSDTGAFQDFPNSVLGASDTVHQCHIGADGKFVIIMGNNSPQVTAVGNISTGGTTLISHANGGGGHSDTGYGYYVQNAAAYPGYGATLLWNVSDLGAGGLPVFAEPYSTQCTGSTCYGAPGHPSWINAVPASQTPIAEQYACDSTSNAASVGVAPFGNQVFCYYLDGSVPVAQLQSLIVAPTMINQADNGCPGGAYGQYPKGNIDFTGHYFIWSANLDSNSNCQVFIVKLPTGQLPHPPPDKTPPEVSITTPASAATVSGTVALTADAWDNYAVSQVAWQVDSNTVATETSAPYTYDLDTAKLAMGTHTLAAVATDEAGNTATSSVQFTVGEGGTVTPDPAAGTAGSGTLSVAMLILLGLMAAAGWEWKRRRHRLERR